MHYVLLYSYGYWLKKNYKSLCIFLYTLYTRFKFKWHIYIQIREESSSHNVHKDEVSEKKYIIKILRGILVFCFQLVFNIALF